MIQKKISKQLYKATLIVTCAFLLGACAKEETPEDEPPVQTDNGSFSWTLSSGQTVNADSAHCYNSINTIYAFKNGAANSIEVTLSALSVGSYSISSSTGNTFNFANGSTSYNGTSGSFAISANANNKLSGNFSVNITGGTLTSISGSFQDIAKR